MGQVYSFARYSRPQCCIPQWHGTSGRKSYDTFRTHRACLLNILSVALQAAASRAPGVAVSTLRIGEDAALHVPVEEMSVPSMNDGLDDGNGAWWDPQDDRDRVGGMFPPIKPTLRDDVSALAIRKLASPRERDISLAGKHPQQFYGAELVEHLDTVRKHLTSPQDTSAKR